MADLMYNKFLEGPYHMKTILISTDVPDQSNLPEFIRQISKIDGFTDHLNLFARDFVDFYLKFGSSPKSLNELKAFVIDKIGNDPEVYLFGKKQSKTRGRFKRRGRFLVKQVIPLKSIYEFLVQDEKESGFGCYVVSDNDTQKPATDSFDIKVCCPVKLVTSSPEQMASYLKGLRLQKAI